MSYKIKSANIYYTDLDKLILQCVTPEMENLSSNFDLWFWERGCIGGKHLKVRWVEKKDANNIQKVFFGNVRKFLKQNPSVDSRNSYKIEAGKKLAKTERRKVSESELVYRVNEIKSFSYKRTYDIDSSEITIDILHNFLHDSRQLCTQFLSNKPNKVSLVMSLMLIFAIEQFDNVEEGCIGFRAHWDNYEHWFKPAILSQRIKQHYEANKSAIHQVVKHILEIHENQEILKNHEFVKWISILRKYRMMVYKHQLAGNTLISKPINEKGVVETSLLLKDDGKNGRSKQFLEKLYKQTNYLGNLAELQGLQMTRITINLIYHMFSNLGVSSFERMSCSYFVHRSVEELLDIDLANVLEKHMKKAIGDRYIGH
jgi:hypothetical protein